MSSDRTSAAPLSAPPAGLFAGLIDDAAVFPPGSAALPDALNTHRRLRQSPACTSIGPLLVPASKIRNLLDLLENPAEPLSIGVIGGPGDVAGLSRTTSSAAHRQGLTISGVEIGTGGRPLDEVLTELTDLDTAGSRATGAAKDGARTDIALEIDRGHPEQLETVAAHRDRCSGRVRGKFRTGGIEPDAVPSADELADVLSTAVRLALPIKLTAGLHHAVRTAEQHGVLNVLVAVDAAFDRPTEVRRILEDDDGERLAAALHSWDHARVHRAREIFTSFGCCGVLEPLSEAARLGVIGQVSHDLTVSKEHG